MMEDKFLVLYRNYDELHIQLMSMKEVAERLAKASKEGFPYACMDEPVPAEEWPDLSMLIVRGKVVKPEARQVVTEWRL